jgi:predicted enzyme related to lactoylglutathione lyase
VSSNVVVWSDLPVTDLDRAMEFYEHVTATPVTRMPGGMDIAVIGAPSESPVVSLHLHVGGKPSHDGATIYLNSNGDIAGMVARVVEAGGKVLQEPQNMGEMVGWIAFFEDSEGNRVGIQQAAV